MTPRSVVVVLVVLVGCAAACTKRNPDACCSNAVECEQIGFDDITPCLDLRVCVGGNCVAPQCTTSAECGPAAPYCVGQICSASCPDDSFCPADSPVCDPSGACRPCADDGECASGICLAAEGVCAAEADAVFVSMSGTDAGECTSAAPCLTMPYGLARITAQRRVLRIVSLDYVAADGFTIAQDVYVDGANTRLQRISAGPVVTVTSNATVVIEGVRILAATAVTLSGATLTLHDVFSPGEITGGGDLRIVASDLSSIRCQYGLATVSRSRVVALNSISCVVDVSRSVIDVGKGPAIYGTFSGLTLENNLFLRTDYTGTAVWIQSSFPPSAVRHNTFVRTTAGIDAGNAISCTGGAALTSNVVAWGSSQPIDPATTCAIRSSVFDLATTGVPAGNESQIVTDIFADVLAGDFRPGASSLAKEGAEAGLGVTLDYAGGIRPQPAGTVPDIGAFEVP